MPLMTISNEIDVDPDGVLGETLLTFAVDSNYLNSRRTQYL